MLIVWFLASFALQLVSLKMVLANGTLAEFSPRKNPHLFNAVGACRRSTLFFACGDVSGLHLKCNVPGREQQHHLSLLNEPFCWMQTTCRFAPAHICHSQAQVSAGWAWSRSSHSASCHSRRCSAPSRCASTLRELGCVSSRHTAVQSLPHTCH